MSADWFEAEITDGIMGLMVLGLPRTPSPDVIPMTAKAWVKTLAPEKLWDQQLDAWRIREAFLVLGRTKSAWPSPSEMLAAMPARKPAPALPPPPPTLPTEEQRLAMRLAKARVSLTVKTKTNGRVTGPFDGAADA